MPRKEMPHVLVLLPGITGSVLQKDGRDVWAISAGAVLKGIWSLGDSVDDLVLAEDPADVDDLGDGVTAPRLIPDTHLIPGLWKIDGYSKVSRTIQEEFDVTEGDNFFSFPYDWRRDNRVAARRLARQSRQWLSRWRQKSGNPDAKVVLIAHSMGGIVARYYLEVLEGWKETKALVTFGTPYRGSLNALKFLVEGFRKGPFGLVDLTRVLRSFTSVYQLLPIYPVYDAGDGQFLRVGETTEVPNVNADGAANALAFHNEIKVAVDEHLTDDAYRRDGYSIFPVVGIRQPTLQSARRHGDTVEFLAELAGQDLTGDGTVPRVSATPLELSDARREMFASTMHGSLQNADAVLSNLHGILTGLDLNLGDFFGAPERRIPLSLSLEDAYLSDESIEIRVVPGDANVNLRVAVTAVDVEQPVRQAVLHDSGDGVWGVVVPPLPAGAYRVVVEGGDTVEPVTDLFMVFQPDSLDQAT